ncbi:CGNR zinc finger domain-containing protein [Actinoplanes sp. NPDC051494]|uniref:CGNR zinc finger domain-containing protein n=1 Tax=Actinoplanes sp. NPDC051494 TaxID=3363907 RepID=UPI00379F2058
MVAGESAHALTPLLAGVVSRPSVGDDGLTWTVDAGGAQAVLLDAVTAWSELRRSRPGRLRPCANDECALFLLDRSKAGNGRWCSMATCGNKLKARRHHQRARAEKMCGRVSDRGSDVRCQGERPPTPQEMISRCSICSP